MVGSAPQRCCRHWNEGTRNLNGVKSAARIPIVWQNAICYDWLQDLLPSLRKEKQIPQTIPFIAKHSIVPRQCVTIGTPCSSSCEARQPLKEAMEASALHLPMLQQVTFLSVFSNSGVLQLAGGVFATSTPAWLHHLLCFDRLKPDLVCFRRTFPGTL